MLHCRRRFLGLRLILLSGRGKMRTPRKAGREELYWQFSSSSFSPSAPGFVLAAIQTHVEFRDYPMRTWGEKDAGFVVHQANQVAIIQCGWYQWRMYYEIYGVGLSGTGCVARTLLSTCSQQISPCADRNVRATQNYAASWPKIALASAAGSRASVMAQSNDNI